jgi:hypothetical protein
LIAGLKVKVGLVASCTEADIGHAAAVGQFFDWTVGQDIGAMVGHGSAALAGTHPAITNTINNTASPLIANSFGFIFVISFFFTKNDLLNVSS